MCIRDSIPTIGLAKQLEEVYVPERDATVMLDRKSPALHVLQRIRDEAHRFAITYHRSLRASHELTSALDEIPGIGPKRRRQLLMQYKTIDQIKQASLEDLLAVEGMNHASAEAVYTWAHKDVYKRQALRIYATCWKCPSLRYPTTCVC